MQCQTILSQRSFGAPLPSFLLFMSKDFVHYVNWFYFSWRHHWAIGLRPKKSKFVWMSHKKYSSSATHKTQETLIQQPLNCRWINKHKNNWHCYKLKTQWTSWREKQLTLTVSSRIEAEEDAVSDSIYKD